MQPPFAALVSTAVADIPCLEFRVSRQAEIGCSATVGGGIRDEDWDAGEEKGTARSDGEDNTGSDRAARKRPRTIFVLSCWPPELF